MVILGLIFGMSGDDKETQKAKAESTQKEADDAQGMTKAELEERQAHLLRTQAALIAADAEETEEAKKQQATQQQKAAAAAPAPAPKGASGPSPKPAAKKPAAGSLDGLGDDIMSGLK
jgi:hypothetical protein